MIVIDDILVSDELLEKKFICDLNKCKGACCQQGDYGAPVDKKEMDIIAKIYPILKPYLTEEALTAIEKNGLFKPYKNESFMGTNLLEDGSCVFVKKNEIGMLECMIEKAFANGETEYKKPISCHLYPVRVMENPEVNLTAVNYSEWDICKAACELGIKENLPLYQFVKEAIIRKFGAAFYEQLDGAYHFQSDKK